MSKPASIFTDAGVKSKIRERGAHCDSVTRSGQNVERDGTETGICGGGGGTGV